MLKPGMTVLDIGFGWAGFARWAAEKYHVKVLSYVDVFTVTEKSHSKMQGIFDRVEKNI